MALSQCLDDSPARWPLLSKRGNNNNELNLQELYNERHRLALEELVSGGPDGFMEFLRRENIHNFLSDQEICSIGRAAVAPRCPFLQGDEVVVDQSVCSSALEDCSSVTYFPEVSDLEPPLLELGWPAFTSGSFRGVTRAVAHFQPSYGDCIYSCKEAARRMIKSAKEVIAIVTDSLTDLDIFKDLQEACSKRRVPVYILLDQSCAPAFLKMCSNINVRLDDLQQMRVRTITGGTYFMRSGAKITGEVHERFMLIDGNRVATGSYRFNWTDAKLNSSNLIELSGQITENFDEEFRILYAQSMPICTRYPASNRNSGIFDQLLIKHPGSSQPGRQRPAEPVCLTSTPSRAHASAVKTTSQPPGESDRNSNSSTIGEDRMEQEYMQEVLTGSAAQCQSSGQPPLSNDVLLCHVSTQTSCPQVDSAVQTDPVPSLHNTGLLHCPDDKAAAPRVTSASVQTDNIQTDTVSSSEASSASGNHGVDRSSQIHHCTAPPDGHLRDCFHRLTKERQYHYSALRTKLEHMVSMLSHRRELVDLTNRALGPSLHSLQDRGPGNHPGLVV